MNYYQRFLGDYARDTRHLSLISHGAYSLLLDAYYATEKPLPSDLDSLCRICGAIHATEREAVKVVANTFFPVGRDGLRHNRRADVEIEKALPRIAAAKSNGLRGGRPPLTQQEPNGLPGSPPGGETALHLHHSSTSTPTPKERTSPARTAGFLDFWKAYPRKTAKLAAERAWRKIKVDQVQPLLKALTSYKFDPDPKFIPHPATWLNQGRWEDETTNYGICKFCPRTAVQIIRGTPVCDTPRHVDNANGR